MASQHIVQQGETLVSIAAGCGLTPEQVWADESNAELRQTRISPNILLPGDRIYLPDKKVKSELCAVERRHRFRLRAQVCKLRLVLVDAAGQPIANQVCELQVEFERHPLVTDANGRVEQDIPVTARNAVLTVMDMELPLKIGFLDPVTEVPGQVARLNNLGYDAGSTERPEPQQLRSAVEEFQCDHGLVVDGLCGPQTQDKLREIHGC